MDESGFSTVPSKVGKVIALKGLRRVGQITAAERGTMITMALTVSASGNSTPPFFLFPRKNMQTCFLDNVSSGAAGFANGSGWMCQPEFVHFMRHFIKHVKPSKEAPVLLLLDNHSSHLSVDALDLAVANGVNILSFPPHCSHKLQPLDVSVFGPKKAYYRSQCSAWQKNNANKVLEIRHIAGLVCATLDIALSQKTIKSGFAATGIQPFNPDIFTDSDFVQAVEQNELESVIELQLEDEDQRRIVSDELAIGSEEGVKSLPSTSRPSSSMSGSVSSLLDEIDPLQRGTPKKISKRGRKAMESSELTSPEQIANLKKNADAKNKQSKPSTSASASSQKKDKNQPAAPEDLDFSIICLRFLPKKLNEANSIKCAKCKRPVHKKCPKLDRNCSIFVCKRCLEDEEEEDDD